MLFQNMILLFVLNLLIRVALLTSQSNYFVNDRFVCDCGCSGELRQYLQLSEPNLTGYRSTLETITATAPAKQARISRIEAYLSMPRPVSAVPARISNDPLRIHGGNNYAIRQPEARNTAQTRVSGFSVISRNDQ